MGSQILLQIPKIKKPICSLTVHFEGPSFALLNAANKIPHVTGQLSLELNSCPHATHENIPA